MSGNTFYNLIRTIKEVYPKELSQIIFEYCDRPCGSQSVCVVSDEEFSNKFVSQDNNKKNEYDIKNNKKSYIFDKNRKKMREYNINDEFVKEWELDVNDKEDKYYKICGDKIVILKHRPESTEVIDIYGDLVCQIKIPQDKMLITGNGEIVGKIINNKIMMTNRRMSRLNDDWEIIDISDSIIYEYHISNDAIYISINNNADNNTSFICQYNLKGEIIKCHKMERDYIYFDDDMAFYSRGLYFECMDLEGNILFNGNTHENIFTMHKCRLSLLVYFNNNRIEIRDLLY